MSRVLRWTPLVLLLALLVGPPAVALHAQTPDTSHVLLATAPIAIDTGHAVASDSLSPVVLPTGCKGIACVKAFVIGNQLYLVTGLCSILLFFLAKLPWFANLKNWITIAVQLTIGFLFSLLITGWGGAPDPAVNALISTALSALLGGMTFRFGRVQPGNDKTLPGST